MADDGEEKWEKGIERVLGGGYSSMAAWVLAALK